MHCLGQRDQRFPRIRPEVKVHDRVLADLPRDAGPVRDDPLDTAVGEIGHVVEPRDVHTATRGEPQQQPVAAAWAARVLPLANDFGDGEDDLLAVAQHGGVDELGDRFRVERRVSPGDDHRVFVAPVDRLDRDACQLERSEHVRVTELGGEGDAEKIERGDRPVRVDGELADLVLAHEHLEVRPDGVGPLCQHPVTFVQDLVEDLNALVGQADFIRIRIHQCPPDGFVVGTPVLDGCVELAAHVLDRLLYAR